MSTGREWGRGRAGDRLRSASCNPGSSPGIGVQTTMKTSASRRKKRLGWRNRASAFPRGWGRRMIASWAEKGKGADSENMVSDIYISNPTVSNEIRRIKRWVLYL